MARRLPQGTEEPRGQRIFRGAPRIGEAPWTGLRQVHVGVQAQARRHEEVSSVRPGVYATRRRRLRSNLLRKHALDVSAHNASLAAARGYNLRRWDFVTAYLQGELELNEVVYCTPPRGGFMGAFSSDFGSVPIMCVVRKPIYPAAGGSDPSSLG